MAARFLSARPPFFSAIVNGRHRASSHIRPLASALSWESDSSTKSQRKLIIYTKPGCCLCDGLKEKLHLAFKLPGPDSLHDVQLQERNISSNHEWEKAYQYEIPVLVRVLADGTEEMLPRLSPRLNAELIQKKLAAALR
ncbi:uncharacterized protein LOC18431223 [Amborella trichopoda]|uniref:uncharacterized protein LOC18431223 n=1 Tax=Amborella trichopoda TaxID=13333 RepID=UPI0005D4451C|nr:uncharacterized protein LOC18431223 [Amborella trichopoda]|eukprot:XP_011622201.1 uncharacterized protein LOC18431223 [Amborella trichopoda]